MFNLSHILLKNNIKIIVISGDYCSGKTFVANLIKDDLNIQASFNKLDFITRKILYVLDINPIFIGYNSVFSNLLEDKVQSIFNEAIFLKEQIRNDNGVTTEHLDYFIKNILNFKIDINKLNSDVINDIIKNINIIYKKPRNLLDEKDKMFFYQLTRNIYDDIVSKYIDLTLDINMQEQLNNEFYLYKPIFDEDRIIIYYAYNQNELSYFDSYLFDYSKCIKVFVDMDYHIRSQFISTKYQDKLKEWFDFNKVKNRASELEIMKKNCDIVIKNDVDFDYRLKNKILNYLSVL